MVARDPASMQAVIFRPRCKQWSCPTCAEINKALWMIRAYKGAKTLMQAGIDFYFLTLTSHEKLTASQSLYVWPRAWAKLRDKMKYENGGVFSYLMIPEHHESGKIHVHAIESAGLGESWIKTAARTSGLGYMDEEDKLRTPTGAAHYVTKYLTKSIGVAIWPRGFRRIRASRDWPKLDMPETDWLFNCLPPMERIESEVDRLEQLGFKVQVVDHLIAWEIVRGSPD